MSEFELPDAVSRQIAEAVAGGRKIEAIKIYRGATGASLKESKEYVDALALGRTPTPSPRQTAPAGPTEASAETNRRIVEALRDGRKIDAIKIHREATGAVLKESKEYVESLETRSRSGGEKGPGEQPAFGHPHVQTSGCGASVFLVLALLAAVAGLLAFS